MLLVFTHILSRTSEALNLFVNRLKCEQRTVGIVLCAGATLWGQSGFQGHMTDKTWHQISLGLLMKQANCPQKIRLSRQSSTPVEIKRLSLIYIYSNEGVHRSLNKSVTGCFPPSHLQHFRFNKLFHLHPPSLAPWDLFEPVAATVKT